MEISNLTDDLVLNYYCFFFTFSDFWNVLLQEIRAIAEGKEFADSYSAYQ